MSDFEITSLITSLMTDKKVMDATAFAMEGIQRSLIVAQLPEELRTIMNMWARTGWYDNNGEAKFERCLWKVVSREMHHKMYDFLVKRRREEWGQMPEEEDLYYALEQVMHALACLGSIEEYWPTLGAQLADEAERWVSEHEEHQLIEDGDRGYFIWYDCVNEVVCYHMPHLPKPVEYEEDYEDCENDETWVYEKEEEEETSTQTP
jgi:hypothetical protein